MSIFALAPLADVTIEADSALGTTLIVLGIIALALFIVFLVRRA